MSWRAAALSLLLSGPVLAAEPAAPAEEEIVDLDALDDGPKAQPGAATVPTTRVPEHDYDRRLLLFPILLVLILAWNVKWKPDPPPAKKA